MPPRKRLALDVETFRIQPGLLIPKLVCLSVSDGEQTRLYDRNGAIAVFRQLIADDTYELVGHHFVFDLAVLAKETPGTLPMVFDGLRRGRLRCTMIRQQLIDIAEDRFKFWRDKEGRAYKNTHGLAQLALRHLGIVLPKDPSIRTNFHELLGVPIDEWPANRRTYASDDATVDWKVAAAQDEYVGHEEFPTENLQMRSAWALHLMSAQGIRTNPGRVAACRTQWLDERTDLDRELVATGLVRADGSKDTKAIAALVIAACQRQGVGVPVTPTGDVSLTKQVLKDCKDTILNKLVKRNQVSKYIETYLPLLLQGIELPFNAGYHTLVQSGRTSCGAGEESDVGNMQNLPRSGPVRECFEARPKKLFCATDLDTAEMRSLAEVCTVIGISPVILAEELRAGMDPHVSVAAEFLGLPYEEAMARYKAGDSSVDNARNLAKIYNFGLGGGMGAEGFVEYAKGYGLDLELGETREGIATWKRHFREMPQYFRYITNKTKNGRATTRHPITGFVRAGTSFTELSNHYFQHLTACCAKESLCAITEECYLGRSQDGVFDGHKKISPLFGSRPVGFFHDDVTTEVPEEIAHEAAHRQVELMKGGADMYIKSVPNGSSMVIMKHLHKKAKAVYSGGRLVPWTPPQKTQERAA
jgi:DNA polymerase-1